MHELITTWRNFPTNISPYLLPGDKVLLQDSNRDCHMTSWIHYISDSNVGDPHDKRFHKCFHLGLLPQPFTGNIESASIYILMLNPGFGPSNYFGEYQMPEYRKAIISNLKQNHKDGRNPFFLLDPRFSWHGGYDYWHKKLRNLIAEFASGVHISYGKSREFFQQKIAVLDLVPYHSINFSMPKSTLNELRSVKLIRSYVNEVLVPKAKRGQCIIIIARGEKKWELHNLNKLSLKQIIIYKKGAARSAYLTPNSSGGKAILKFLMKIWGQTGHLF